MALDCFVALLLAMTASAFPFDAVDGMRCAAVVAMKDDAQSLDLDQRRRRHVWLAAAAAMPASMVARSVIPAGFLRVGRNGPEVHPALAADRFEFVPVRPADRRGRRHAGRARTTLPRRGSTAPPIACRACRRRRLHRPSLPRSTAAQREGIRSPHRPLRCRRARAHLPACCRQWKSRRRRDARTSRRIRAPYAPRSGPAHP